MTGQTVSSRLAAGVPSPWQPIAEVTSSPAPAETRGPAVAGPERGLYRATLAPTGSSWPSLTSLAQRARAVGLAVALTAACLTPGLARAATVDDVQAAASQSAVTTLQAGLQSILDQNRASSTALNASYQAALSNLAAKDSAAVQSILSMYQRTAKVLGQNPSTEAQAAQVAAARTALEAIASLQGRSAPANPAAAVPPAAAPSPALAAAPATAPPVVLDPQAAYQLNQARLLVRQMAAVSGNDHKNEVGLGGLKLLAARDLGTPTQVLASATVDAAAGVSDDARKQSMLQTTLNTIVGLPTNKLPLGALLAQTASEEMKSLDSDARTSVGKAFASAIVRRGTNPLERQIAQAGVQAATDLSSDNAAATLQAAFDSISKGDLVSQSAGPALSKVASAAMVSRRDDDDKARIGLIFAKSVRANSSVAGEKLISGVLVDQYNSWGWDQARASMVASFGVLSSGQYADPQLYATPTTPVGQALATAAVQSSAAESSSQTYSYITLPFAKVIQASSGSPNEKLVAKTAVDAQGNLSWEGDRAVLEAALKSIQSGSPNQQALGPALGSVAVNAMQNSVLAGDAKNRALVGQAFSNAVMASGGTTATEKQLAAAAVACGGASWDGEAAIYQAMLGAIAHPAPGLRPAALLASTTATVMQDGHLQSADKVMIGKAVAQALADSSSRRNQAISPDDQRAASVLLKTLDNISSDDGKIGALSIGLQDIANPG